MRSECGARGRNDTLHSRAASENTPGRHYDRSATSSLDWDRRCFAHDLSNHRDHALRRVPGSACPELNGGVGSPPEEPRWNADRRARPAGRAPRVSADGRITRLSAFRLPFLFYLPEASLKDFSRSLVRETDRTARFGLLRFFVVVGIARARIASRERIHFTSPRRAGRGRASGASG